MQIPRPSVQRHGHAAVKPWEAGGRRGLRGYEAADAGLQVRNSWGLLGRLVANEMSHGASAFLGRSRVSTKSPSWMPWTDCAVISRSGAWQLSTGRAGCFVASLAGSSMAWSVCLFPDSRFQIPRWGLASTAKPQAVSSLPSERGASSAERPSAQAGSAWQRDGGAVGHDEGAMSKQATYTGAFAACMCVCMCLPRVSAVSHQSRASRFPTPAPRLESLNPGSRILNLASSIVNPAP